MVICTRDAQPIGGMRQALLKRAFGLFFGHAMSDVFCRVRLSRRAVLEEVGGFGVRQHFIPIIAAERGYRVVETPVRSARRHRARAVRVPPRRPRAGACSTP